MSNLQLLDQVQQKMQTFETGSPKRIQHFTKVHSFAAQIGRGEGLDPELQLTLELTAILHDIGIKPSKEKYGYCNGKTQEEMGPPLARDCLAEFSLSKERVDRICYLIANHHTYDNVVGLDYRILLEADFLVNLLENDTDKEGILSAYENIFRTETGKQLCTTMFAIDPSNVSVPVT